ncbi:MAG: Ig-like domain-containing protein [Clostridia bacterium]|nr:Ig-like domain-containing protein [Clostridia bacterium]MDH7573197.1 Ig-like domain-containing protein [Clostridia bacterium]
MGLLAGILAVIFGLMAASTILPGFSPEARAQDGDRVTVTGQFAATCRVNGLDEDITLPVRKCRAELVEVRAGDEGLYQITEEVLATGETDENGRVTFTVDRIKHRGSLFAAYDDVIDVKIVVYPDNPAAKVEDFGPAGALSWHRWPLETRVANNVSGPTLSLTATATGDHGFAFYLADVLLAGQRELKKMVGELPLGQVSVDWLASGDQCAYKPLFKRIYIVPSARTAENVLHEYGHALHHAAAGTLPSYSPSDEQAGVSGAAPRDDVALTEGWADFLAQVLLQRIHENDSNLRGKFFYDPEWLREDLEGFTFREGISSARHIPAVTATLWDLYDDVATWDLTQVTTRPAEVDAVSDFAEIWRILGSNPSSIKDFYGRWKVGRNQAGAYYIMRQHYLQVGENGRVPLSLSTREAIIWEFRLCLEAAQYLRLDRGMVESAGSNLREAGDRVLRNYGWSEANIAQSQWWQATSVEEAVNRVRDTWPASWPGALRVYPASAAQLRAVDDFLRTSERACEAGSHWQTGLNGVAFAAGVTDTDWVGAPNLADAVWRFLAALRPPSALSWKERLLWEFRLQTEACGFSSDGTTADWTSDVDALLEYYGFLPGSSAREAWHGASSADLAAQRLAAAIPEDYRAPAQNQLTTGQLWALEKLIAQCRSNYATGRPWREGLDRLVSQYLPGGEEQLAGDLTHPRQAYARLVDWLTQRGPQDALVVRYTDPAGGATEVPAGKSLVIGFSKIIQPGSAYNQISVTDSGGRKPALSVTPGFYTLVLDPTADLSPNATYTVTVPQEAVRDADGHSLTVRSAAGQAANAYTFSFTTAALNEPPRIVSTDPTHGATGVDPNKTITVIFSEPVQPGSTYGAISLILADDNYLDPVHPLPATVSLAGSTLTIDPAAPLARNTWYTVSVPMGAVADQGGVANQGHASFTFRTKADPLQVVSTHPAHNSTGAKVNHPITVTFNQDLSPGPALGQIVLQDPLGNPVPVQTNLSGNTLRLTPASPLGYSRVYRVTIPAQAVVAAADGTPFSPPVSYQFSFQTEATPDTTPPHVWISPTPYTYSTPQTVSLGADEPATIYYTLDGTNPTTSSSRYTAPLVIGATTTIKYLAVDAAGNQSAVQTATYVIDYGGPAVVGSTPADNTGGVNPNLVQQIWVNLSEMCRHGPAFSSIALKKATGTQVSATVELLGDTIKITPAPSLEWGTAYVVTIPAGAVADTAGNLLAATSAIKFTTMAAPAAPTVVATSPADGATGVPVDKPISVTFSENVLPGPYFDYEITGADGSHSGGIELKGPDGRAVGISKQISGAILEITPLAPLAYGTAYTVRIPYFAVRDQMNRMLESAVTFSFTTEPAPASLGPQVVGTTPADRQRNVALTGPIVVTFDRDIQAGKAFAGISVTAADGSGLSLRAIVSGQALALVPVKGMQPGRTYTVVIPAGAVRDLTGAPLAREYRFSFRTATLPMNLPDYYR